MKHDGQGEVNCFKGRLVVQGFSQKYGIDYDEVFSPVSCYSSIRSLLAFATERGLLVHQMDVVTAFLNGDLKEENLHGSTTWLHSAWQREQSVQTQEVILRSETVSTLLERKSLQSPETTRF